MPDLPHQRAMADVDKVAEAIWRTDPFRMGDPDTWTGSGDQNVYRRMAVAAIDALGLTEEGAVQDVAKPARVYQSAPYIEAVRKRPVPEVRIVRRLVGPWVEVQP